MLLAASSAAGIGCGFWHGDMRSRSKDFTSSLEQAKKLLRISWVTILQPYVAVVSVIIYSFGYGCCVKQIANPARNGYGFSSFWVPCQILSPFLTNLRNAGFKENTTYQRCVPTQPTPGSGRLLRSEIILPLAEILDCTAAYGCGYLDTCVPLVSMSPLQIHLDRSCPAALSAISTPGPAL